MVILKDHGADVDISNKVNVVEFSDAAPLSCRLVLDAKGGRFLTSGTKIQKWDRIFVRLTDPLGNKVESVFHVKFRNPIRDTGKGLQLELQCPHESSNRMTAKVSRPNRRMSGYEALNNYIEQVNATENRGSKDPQIIVSSTFDMDKKLGNRLNPGTSNDYIAEYITLEKAINEVLDKEGNVVAGGGAQQFHYFRFVSLYDHDLGTNFGKIGIQVFEQGYMKNGSSFTSTPQITLKKKLVTDSTRSNTLKLKGSMETELGTNLVAIGDKNSGSYPDNFAQYQGEKDTFRFVQDWASDVLYQTNMRVKYNGIYYKCISDITTLPEFPPPSRPTKWISDNVFVPSVQYSPLTRTKAQYWINALAGAKHAATNNEKCQMVDFNCIINDKDHHRTWCDIVSNSLSAVLANTTLLAGGKARHGFRVLCVNPASGSGVPVTGGFAGNDKNGVQYAGNLVEYQDPNRDATGEWVVIRQTQTDDEIVEWYEGLSWTYSPCSGILIGGSCLVGSRNGLWQKGAYGFGNLPGIGEGAVFRANEQFDCMHIPKWGGSNIELGNEKIAEDDASSNSAVFINFDPTTDLRNSIAGLNFRFPWPPTANAIPYGAVNIGEQIALEVFDFNNMDRNHKGKRDWFGPDVVDYFPIQGFAFWEKFQEFLPLGLLNPSGSYKMGVWLADRFDNKVIIEYVHGANNTTTPQDAPLGKAKGQFSVQGIKSFTPSKDPEMLEVFDWREVIIGGIVTRDSFDEQFKYITPISSVLTLFTTNSRFFNAEKIHLAIDAWRMTKPLVATNVKTSKPDRNISPEILKADNIISKSQLQNYVDSYQAIYNFERKEFDVDTPLRCNISFGDPVYYEDKEVIDDTTDGKANTIKTVADKIVYTVSKPLQGPGGFLRTVYLVTRLWA